MDERAKVGVIIPDAAVADTGASYRRIVEQSPLVVYIHDGNRPPAMTYVSPQVERMLGIAPALWLEQPFLWVTRIHPDDRESVLAQVDEACLEERRFSVESRNFGHTTSLRKSLTRADARGTLSTQAAHRLPTPSAQSRKAALR